VPRTSLLLGSWVRRFLLEHLVAERNLARNTQISYRDTLALLLPFISTKKRKAIEFLAVCDLSADLLKRFLDYLETARSCSIRTRNQRLAALHALARFIAERSPEHIEWSGQIRAVPFKRHERSEMHYLDKPEMDAILAAPDCSTARGQRDRTLLLFMYNSGARVSEAASLKIADLKLRSDAMSDVRLMGKGRKMRRCPLWPDTAKELLLLTRDRSEEQPVFLNRLGQSITRYGIHAILRKYLKKARASCPSLVSKRVSPHTIRHTTATHLLRSGVDINTIRAWLGHVSLETTNIYAEVDLERKAQALAECNALQVASRNRKRWRDDPSLIAFLHAL
jgi:integrase/recombinase XerD